MKAIPRKALAFLLALALTLSLPLFAAASPALGDDLDAMTQELGQGTSWTQSVFWSNSLSDLRTENYVTYSPNSRVTPIVTYGAAVTSRTKLTTIAAELEQQGYRVVAGINGDFYNTANGVPLGLVVTDGVIRSGSSYYYALGFTADGRVMWGTPNLTTMAHTPVGDIVVQDINKDRGDKGVYLYTYDFNAKHTTGTTMAGTDVVLTVDSGRLSIGGTVTLTVQQVLTDNTTAVSLTPETFVLSANNSSPAVYREALQQLTPGMQITIQVSAEDRQWESAVYTVGTLYQLVENGQVHSDAALVSGSAPRTAVGIKPNGDILFYTIDGRQSGYSVGASYAMVAKRLIELGCTTAFAMDGGGSTGMLLSLPGQGAALYNSPSDGYERAVTNQIFLVTKDSNATGSGGGFLIRPESRRVLAGASVQLSVTPYDSAFFPTGGDYTLSASAGTVEGNVFHAPAKAGSVTLTAAGSGKRSSVTVQVVESPDSVTVLQSGKAVSSLNLRAGEQVQLSAKAVSNHLTLLSQNDCYSWSVSEGLGTVDENGLFTAADRTISGKLTVRAGNTSVSIPVTVTSGDYFTDIYDNWAREYINAMAERGVVTGKDDGSFQPDASISRQQFAAMLYRALGLKDADYADVSLPFADADSLSSYAVTPVKALYAMGIFNGTESGGKLWAYPHATVSRAQAAAMIARALGVSSDTALSFTDLNQFPSYAPPYVGALVELGIMGGFKDGSFRPLNNVTRAQMCKMLYMMLENR
ncbi:MAG: S-layer homology domain-containing protein [Oscillospiraceae bacterium]